MLRTKFFLAPLCLFLLALPGCKKPAGNAATDSRVVASASPNVAQTSAAQPTASQPSQPAFDACALINGAEVEAIQGSPIKEAKNSERSSGDLRFSQCFYTAAEFSSSVNLGVTQTDAANPGKQTARGFWKETFGRYSMSEEEREREKKNEKPGKEEEKEAAPPKKVEGIGEEAYWTSTRVGGTLYVLKNDAFLRISVGGSDSDENRLKKCKALAEKALPRL
jgi:hypothetical protein